MSFPVLIPVKNDQVQKYLQLAIDLVMGNKLKLDHKLSKSQKVIISKIFKNLNTLCKLTIKEVKEVIKTEPAYQQALADLFFDKKINNNILITNYEQTNQLKGGVQVLLERSSKTQNTHLCSDIQYRIQFTLSTIAKSSVMKPVILLIFRLQNGEEVSYYFNLDQFSQLRYQISQAMKQIYGIQLRTI